MPARSSDAVLLFGAAWLAADTTVGAVAQMTAPGWALAQALGVFQLSCFGAQAIGSAVWTALLNSESGRVLEAVHYRVDPADRDAFIAAMREVRQVRLRAGALVWRLCEDVARPDRWTELWAMESWTEHQREEIRLDEADRAALARAVAMHRDGEPPQVSRYLNIDP